VTVDLNELSDKLEITELLYRYATAIDGGDWPLLDDVFLLDATAELRGETLEGREAIRDLIRGALSGLDASQHIIANPVIVIDGDKAHVTSYLHAQHYLIDQRSGGNTFEVGGIYHDDLERSARGWRIRHRRLERTWVQGNVGVSIEAMARVRAREGK